MSGYSNTYFYDALEELFRHGENISAGRTEKHIISKGDPALSRVSASSDAFDQTVKEMSTIDKVKSAWEYGQGMKLINEGYQEKIKDPAAGEKKITEGTKLVGENIGTMRQGHQFGETDGVLGTIAETAKALIDPDFWTINQVSQMPQNLPLMGEMVGGGIAANALRGAGAVVTAGTGGLAVPGGAALIGAGHAVQTATISHATIKEAEMEAAGVYEQVYNRELKKGLTPDKAREQAMQASEKNYKANLAIIGGGNVLESLSVFGKPLEYMKKAAKIQDAIKAGELALETSKLAKAGKEVGRVAVTGLAEGGEELGQYAAQQWASDESIDLGSTEATESFAAGFGMGAGTHTLGRTVDDILAKRVASRARDPETEEEIQQEMDDARLDLENEIKANPPIAPRVDEINPDLIEKYQDQVANTLPLERATIFKNEIEQSIAQGNDSGTAINAAMDNLMGDLETAAIVNQAFLNTVSEHKKNLDLELVEIGQLSQGQQAIHKATGQPVTIINAQNPEIMVVQDRAGKKSLAGADDLTFITPQQEALQPEQQETEQIPVGDINNQQAVQEPIQAPNIKDQEQIVQETPEAVLQPVKLENPPIESVLPAVNPLQAHEVIPEAAIQNQEQPEQVRTEPGLETIEPELGVIESAPVGEVRTELMAAPAEEMPATNNQKEISSPQLPAYGLTITKTKTKAGNIAWEVTGNTKEHKEALKSSRARWYGPKKAWTFYGEDDPAGKVLAALERAGAKPMPAKEPEKRESTKQLEKQMPQKEIDKSPESGINLEQEDAAKEGNSDAKLDNGVLDPEHDRGAGTSRLPSGVNGDSLHVTAGRMPRLSGQDRGPEPGEPPLQSGKDGDISAAADVRENDTGLSEDRGRRRNDNGSDDSQVRESGGNGKDSEGDSTGGTGVSRESKSKTTKKAKDKRKIAYENYRINEDNPVFIKGGKKARYKANIEALKTLDTVLSENRAPTIEEQRKLALFSGWGALPEVFDYNYDRLSRRETPKYKDWTFEFEETKKLFNEIQEKHFSSEYNYRGGLYQNARSSTMNAHYTSPEIIASMYQALEQMGYKKGILLEPSMGTGNFFGMIPDSLAGKCKLYGVELDPLTGKIAQLLYPNADIRIQGFQEALYPDNLFDAAIGNVPFGDYGINDNNYPKFVTQRIHNYFFARSIDKVKPGGIVAFITSTGTLDAQGNERVRNYLSQKANLIGAIRMPGDAFKDNAGTEVTTDIIFLQKLKDGELPKDTQWTKTVDIEIEDEKYSLNQYYKDHPEMVLGEHVAHKQHGERLAVKSNRDDISQALSEVIEKNLPVNIMDTRAAKPVVELSQEDAETFADMLEGGLSLVKGKLYRKTGSKTIQITENVAQIKHLVELKELAKEVLSMQRDPNVAESDLDAKRKSMKSLYESYVKKYGNLLKVDIRGGKLVGRPHVEKVLGYTRQIKREGKDGKEKPVSVFTTEPETYLLKSLEIEKVISDKEGDLEQTFKPSQILSQRTFKIAQPVDKVNSAADGMIASINELGYVDMDHIVKIYGKPEAEVIAELGDKVYHNPISGWETADEYLSGNVKKKLREVQERIEFQPEYQRNVEALSKIIPADVPLNDITVNLGDAWVPFDITEKVVKQILGFNRRHGDENAINLQYSLFDNTWNLSKGRNYHNTAEMSSLAAGIPKDPLAIVKIALNNSDTIIKYTDKEGKTYVDQEATNALKSKVREIRDSLKDYLSTDLDAAEEIENVYNDKFNNSVPRDYSKIANIFEFVNMNPDIKLRPHQKSAIIRALLGGNTLLAHGVGAGKTYEQIAIAMEAKRLGLANKPLLVVPNTKLTDFENDAKKLYPGAKILALSQDDFDGNSIKRTLALAAANDWDMVIVRHSSFTKIPVSPATQIPALQEEIQELELALAEADDDNRFSRKKMESRLEKIRLKLQAYMENRTGYEGLIFFEDMGFDMLLVDEAHEYKNYSLGGKAASIKGLASGDADKARDMMIKSGYIRKLNGGKKGVIFGTGTPISNSMAEVYVMFKYLRPDLLIDAGINNFDAWADTFTNIREVAEISAKGEFRNKLQFKSFVNLPELITMFREFTDIKMQDSLNLPLPEHEVIKVECEAHPLLERVMKEVEAGWNEAIKNRTLFRLIHKVLNAPQDMRLVISNVDEHKGSKVNKIADNVLKHYKETAKENGTQLIFATTGESSITGFSLWDEMRDKLISKGIPANEIAFIKTGTKEGDLEEIYRKINAGKIRVAIGSFQKMGVGINVQERLFAIHELNAPYRPADIEQAEGRMIRQGNTYYGGDRSVKIYRYVTVGKDGAFSGDAFKWQIIESKIKAINAVMKGDPSVRILEAFDEDAMDAATLKAIAIGDERYIRKVELEGEIEVLRSAFNSFKTGQARARRELSSAQNRVVENNNLIKNMQHAMEAIKAIPPAEVEKQIATIGQKKYSLADKEEKKAAERALKAKIAEYEAKPKEGTPLVKLAEIQGLDLMYKQQYNKGFHSITQGLALYQDRYTKVLEISHRIVKQGKGSQDISYAESVRSILSETEKIIKNFPQKIEKTLKENDFLSKEIAKYEEIVNRPFKQEEELRAKREELKEIDRALGVEAVAVENASGNQTENTAEGGQSASFKAAKAKGGIFRNVYRSGREKSDVRPWSAEEIDSVRCTEEEARRHLQSFAQFHGGTFEGFGATSFRYEPEALNRPEFKATVAIANLLGLKVIPFSYVNKKRTMLDGCVDDEVIFINTKPTMPQESVSWHELGHRFKVMAPELYEQIESHVRQRLTDFKLLQRYYRTNYGSIYKEEDLIEEFIADLVAQAFSKGRAFFSTRELKRHLDGYMDEVLGEVRGKVGNFVSDQEQGKVNGSLAAKAQGAAKGQQRGTELVRKIQIETKQFVKQLDEWEQGKLKSHEVITVCSTPEVLQKLGAEPLPMVITQRTLAKVVFPKNQGPGKHGSHGLPLELVKQIPQQLYNPIMVFDSKENAKHENIKNNWKSLVALTELQYQGESIVVAVHLSKQEQWHIINNIASIHSRPNSQIINWIEKDKLLRYINNEKAQQWCRSRGLQLPKETHEGSSNTNILTEKDIVNLDDNVKPKFKGARLLEADERYHLEDSEIDARMDAACGLPREALKEKLSELWDEIKRKTTREFEWLPRTGEFAELRKSLLNLKKERGIAGQKAGEKLDNITDGLNRYEYSLFAKKVIMDDLLHDADADMMLPFGFTPESLKREMARANQEVEKLPNVQTAMEKRKQAWNEIKESYIEACRKVGFNVEKRMTKEDYYHHQVLEYANAKSKISGTGKKLKTPTNRGFLKKREGSNYDINTDYLQAEFEVMSQMIIDTEITRAIQLINQRYNIVDQLKIQAAQANNELMLEYFQDMIDVFGVEGTAESNYRQMLNKKQAIAFGKLSKLAAKGELPTGQDNQFEWVVTRLAARYWSGRKNRMAINDDAELLEAVAQEIAGTRDPVFRRGLFAYLNWLSGQNESEQSHIVARTIFKGIAEKKRKIKSTLGDRYVTWQDLIPEGYVTWQPREGNMFYMVDTIPEQYTQMLQSGMLEQMGIPEDMVKKVLAVGQRFPEMVVKEEIILTLDNIQKENLKAGPGWQVWRGSIRLWKQWQLLSLRRFFKYNIRNFTGDFDAVIAGNPSALKKAPEAWRDLWQAFFTEKKKMTPELREWFERGGFESLFQAQEISDVNRNRQFRHLMEVKMKKSPIENLASLPKAAWLKYWDIARTSTDFREALLRYACYLDYLEQLENNDGIPENYGASIRDEVMGLSDIRDRAYKLSNNLMGAYDEVSVAGQWLADNLLPFWRWNEVNFVRYTRLFKNAYQDGKLLETVGRKAATVPIRSAFMAMKIGKFALKATALTALINVWNYLFFRDEEDDLPDDVKERLHIIFGRNDEGNVLYFSRLGALQDFLDWFGADTPVQYVQDYLSGKKGIKEIAADMAKDPLNKVAGALGPHITIPLGLLTQSQLYPDATKPRHIYDRWQYLFDSFGLGNEYKGITGKPTPGYIKSISDIFLYKSDPYQSGYYATLDEKARFQKKIHKSSEGWRQNERGEALRNVKLALRYQDKEAARHHLIEYLALGGTAEGLERSLQTLDPLYGLTIDEKIAFINQLDAEGKRSLAKALEYYSRVIGGSPVEESGS